ncbi:MAG: MarR family transcriptional regulator [Thermoplasmata archaeon]|nr:MarR family transcriptional regulator [Thermoplasmata archaeon]MCI4359287.1 MarR family transcriptional regulator [Thermoplasmata archaeon]
MKDWDMEVGPHARVDERVLGALASNSGTLAFNGLRRTLKVHPESLVRALRRLEREGMVLRSENGYALREPVPPRAASGPPRARTVASVRLPPNVSAHDLLGRLAGRWLGPLRWLGVYEHPGDPWLVWTLGTTSEHAMLSVRRGTLRVLADADSTSPEADDAAYALLARALDSVRDTPRTPSDEDLTRFSRDERPNLAN